MNPYKIRVKIGDNEFEAEGPEEAVKSQFDAFKEMLRAAPTVAAVSPVASSDASSEDRQPAIQRGNLERLGKLYNYDQKNKVVSIRIPPKGARGAADAILLIVYGYAQYMGLEEVLVGVIKESLKMSGFGSVERVDRVSAKDVSDGLYIKTGVAKGGKYRLTNTGVTRASELAEQLLSQVC